MEENAFLTKESINDYILRSAWAEDPLAPLHRACRDGDLLSLTYLIVQGDRQEVFRSVNQKDKFLAWTPAHWAVYFGKLECLQLLCTHGLITDELDGRFGQSLTHLASVADQPQVLLWLIQNGLSVKMQDSLGETPAHKAVHSGSVKCLEVLKSFGAPLNVQNNHRQTPYDVAVSLGLQQCGHYLNTHCCPTGSISRTCKRSLDNDCYSEGTKRQRNEFVEVIGPRLDTPGGAFPNGIHMQLADPHHENGDKEMDTENDLNTSFMEYPNDSEPWNGYANGHTSMVQANGRRIYPTPPQRCRMLCGHLQ